MQNLNMNGPPSSQLSMGWQGQQQQHGRPPMPGQPPQPGMPPMSTSLSGPPSTGLSMNTPSMSGPQMMPGMQQPMMPPSSFPGAPQVRRPHPCQLLKS